MPVAVFVKVEGSSDNEGEGSSDNEGVNAIHAGPWQM